MYNFKATNYEELKNVLEFKDMGNNEYYYANQPQEVTSDTTTVFYAYGSGGHDAQWAKAASLSSGQNKNLCLFGVYNKRGYETNWHNLAEKSLADYEKSNNVSINRDNVIFAGHSASGTVSASAAADYIKENNIKKPQTVVWVDGKLGKDTWLIPQENLETLKENDTTIIAFCQPGYKADAYKKFATTSGLNMVIIEELDNDDRAFDKRHVNESYYLFDPEKDRISYVNGEGVLRDTPKGYEITVYKDNGLVYTNEGNPHDLSIVNTRDKLNKLLDIDMYTYKIQELQTLNEPKVATLDFSINGNEFDASLNDVLSTIGQTSYLYDSSSVPTESTVKTISRLARLEKNFFNTNTDLLMSITNEMKEYKIISPAFSALDKKMEQSAMKLNYNVPTHTGPTTLKTNDRA